MRMTQPIVADFVYGGWRPYSKEWKKPLKAEHDPWPTASKEMGTLLLQLLGTEF